MTTYLLTHSPDKNVDQNKFPTFIKQEFSMSQEKTDIGLLIQRWNKLERLKDYNQTNRDILSQLFGLYRIWGHHTIKGLGGSIALKKVTRRDYVIDHTSVRLVYRKWKEYFCMSYYSKEKRWPFVDQLTFEANNCITDFF